MPSINGTPRNAPKTAFPDLKKLFQLTPAPLTKFQFQTRFETASTTSIQGMFCLLFMYLRHKFAVLNQGMHQMVRCLDYFCQLKKESPCSPLP
ncbi:hypothetical protein NC653_008502 [Populus alba x Populus x berolinensis]|uniref:Uncharacterized protein n=1 Tax=Populus alba x Populus x berolinensis TaxID=444605 RepID=A0AAD6R6K4_9ROSI|nr:hypothetical protein NC653_008502 [Populus alba x Populus x berolinensis]